MTLTTRALSHISLKVVTNENAKLQEDILLEEHRLKKRILILEHQPFSPLKPKAKVAAKEPADRVLPTTISENMRGIVPHVPLPPSRARAPHRSFVGIRQATQEGLTPELTVPTNPCSNPSGSYSDPSDNLKTTMPQLAPFGVEV